jgi:hypothetical protein
MNKEKEPTDSDVICTLHCFHSVNIITSYRFVKQIALPYINIAPVWESLYERQKHV